MGNKIISDNTYGKIMIRLEKAKYMAGDQVNGMIYLDLYKEFPGSVLNLVMTGRERVRLIEVITRRDNHTNTTHYETRVHADEKEFFGHNFPIYSVNAMNFMRGQYSFPFTFMLLDSLPGSFKHTFTTHGERGFGVIEYELFAGFKSMTTSLAFFDKIEMLVDQKAEVPKGPVESHFFKSLKGFCYADLGSVGMRCQFDKDRFIVGDNASMNIEVDATQCKTDISHIHVQLLQVIDIKTSSGSHREHVTNTITSVNLPGIKAGQKRVGLDSIPVVLNIRPQNDEQATTNGSMVQNNYRLQIDAQMDACLCCDQAPSNSTEIKIFNRPHAIPAAPDIPNFTPQQMSPYVCTVSNDYRLTRELKRDLNLDDETNYPAL